MFFFNLLLSFLAVFGNPDVPNNKQECDSVIVLMLSKMEAMQKKIIMLENSGKEMKQTLADVTARFQSEIEELKIQLQSYESKSKNENTKLENALSSERHDGQGGLLVQSDLGENGKKAMRTKRKKGMANSETVFFIYPQT